MSNACVGVAFATPPAAGGVVPPPLPARRGLAAAWHSLACSLQSRLQAQRRAAAPWGGGPAGALSLSCVRGGLTPLSFISDALRLREGSERSASRLPPARALRPATTQYIGSMEGLAISLVAENMQVESETGGIRRHLGQILGLGPSGAGAWGQRTDL